MARRWPSLWYNSTTVLVATFMHSRTLVLNESGDSSIRLNDCPKANSEIMSAAMHLCNGPALKHVLMAYQSEIIGRWCLPDSVVHINRTGLANPLDLRAHCINLLEDDRLELRHAGTGEKGVEQLSPLFV